MTPEERRKQINDFAFNLGEAMTKAYAKPKRKPVESREVKKEENA